MTISWLRNIYCSLSRRVLLKFCFQPGQADSFKNPVTEQGKGIFIVTKSKLMQTMNRGNSLMTPLIILLCSEGGV